MAMSDTGSSFAQWAALYNHHHDPTGPVVLPDDAAADVGIGTAAAAAASPTSAGSSGGSPTKAGAHQQQQQLHGVEGPRIGKPAAARRRSRASRRAPVTLLNTDTANFRAMVQQFTGIPAPPTGVFGVGAGAPVINFAADYGFPPSSSAVMSFDHQLHRSQHPAPLQEQLRRQQQYTGASAPFGYGSGGLLQGGGGGDVFGSHGGFAASSAEDRMLLQSIQAAAQMPPVSAAANASTNGFFA